MLKERRFYNRFNNRLLQTATHTYILPHPALRPYVAHYTFMAEHPQNPPPVLTLVPDASGCFVLMEGENRFFGRVYGAASRAVTVQNESAGRARFFVEFWPGGLAHFLSGQADLADRRLNFREVCPSLFSELCAAFEETEDYDGFVQEVDALLVRKVQTVPASALFGRMVGFIRQTGGTRRIRELSRHFCYSERHLSRVFYEQIGLGIKTFSRVVRLNALLRQMKEGTLCTAALAQEAGFFDSSHLVRELRALTGLTPGEFQAEGERIYQEPVKF